MVDEYQQALTVFTRTPVLGRTKTRLARSLGEDAALAAHIELVEGCLSRLQLQADTRCVLSITETASMANQWAHQYQFELQYQTEGDLGTRMYHSLCRMLRGSVVAAVLVGTDCPAIDSRYVYQAFAALTQKDVVFGPAEDGGYGLVGVRACALPAACTLFEDIAWGGPDVMAISLERACQAQLSVSQLPVIWDIDTVTDWQRYRRMVDVSCKTSD
ncbi:MAG: TIGR04282 family arsenosugar biosynthesis glycosyltransferase [bacterium]